MLIRSEKENMDLCRGCKGRCCKYLTIIINPPETKQEIDRVRWYLLHGVEVFVEEDGTWKVDVPLKCSRLTDENQCSIYTERPQLCRDYDQSDCERNSDKKHYMHLFSDVDQFMEYVAKNMPKT